MSKKHDEQGLDNDQRAAEAGDRSRQVDFVLECNGAEHVYVCGDFNQWRPACLRMIGNPEDGLWEKRLMLPPGRHEYKFVVDGRWLHDPESQENVANVYGSLNSVVEVQR